MKAHRSLFALFLVVFTVAPAMSVTAQPDAEPTAKTELASDAPSRDVDLTRASRSDARPLLVASVGEEEATTAATTTTTTAPPATTTTTKAPKPKPAATKPATEPKKPEKTEEPAVTGTGKEAVVQIARAQIGKAYRMGATGPNAFDCSGLIYYVFNQAGISMPRLVTGDYLPKYKHVSRAELQPGDLVVLSGHAGIYVGNGQMVHASTPRGGVKLSPINSAGTPSGFVRV